MLPVRDEAGGRVARWALVNTVALAGVTLLPSVLGLAGRCYLGATLLLAGWFVWRAVQFVRAGDRDVAARKLFLTSIAYLPLQLGVLVLDRMFLSP
jgi:protoheme IX farnesyltransferase